MENQEKTVRKIRDDYAAQEPTKLDELKSLDKKVKKPPAVIAYVLGAISALILGTGMCLAMKVIGASIMSPAALMGVGVTVGVVGIALCVANYFIYKAALKARKAKYGDKILALGNELLNEEK